MRPASLTAIQEKSSLKPNEPWAVPLLFVPRPCRFVALIIVASLHGMSIAGMIIPPDLQPGDSFQMVFNSSSTTQATIRRTPISWRDRCQPEAVP